MVLFNHRTSHPSPRPLAWFGVAVALAAAASSYVAPVIGLTLLGSVLILSGIVVEMNADRIWAESLKLAKKRRRPLPWWNRPTPFFHLVNTYVLWPFVMLVGLACLVLAFKLI